MNRKQRVSCIMLSLISWSLVMVNGWALAAEPIVPEGATPEKLFDGITLTEGVAVSPGGMVYFSDITFSHASTVENGAFHAGHIWKYNPKI